MKFNNIDHKHRILYEPKIHDPLDLAYLAGIVDGEGCFHACKLKNKPGDGYKNGHYRCVLMNGLLQVIDFLISVDKSILICS